MKMTIKEIKDKIESLTPQQLDKLSKFLEQLCKTEYEYLIADTEYHKNRLIESGYEVDAYVEDRSGNFWRLKRIKNYSKI